MYPQVNISMLCCLILVLVVGQTSQTPVNKKQAADPFTCQKNVMNQLDSYLTEIELVPNGNGKHRFPETIANLKEACKINKKIVNLLTNMANKCMSGFSKNVLQVTLYSIRKSQKTLCRSKPNKEMHDFVAAGKCVNGGQAQFRKCLRQTANNIQLVKFMENKKKIPLICCEIVRAKQCLMNEAKKVKECSETHVETIQNRFNHVSMNTMNIACGDYNEETDRCDHVLPPKGVKLERKNKSFVMSIFELMESFPEAEISPK